MSEWNIHKVIGWFAATPKRLWLTVILITLSIIFWVILESHLFQECIKANQPEHGGQSLEEGIRAFFRIGWWCTGVFIDGNGVSITALATVALTISTIGLWWVTERTLRHARADSERQLRAWVDVDVEIGEIGFKPGTLPGCSIDFKFLCRNVGPTPALKVSIFYDMAKTDDDTGEIASLRKHLNDIRHLAETRPIFPRKCWICPTGFHWGPTVTSRTLQVYGAPVFKVGVHYYTIFDGPNDPPHETMRLFGVWPKDGGCLNWQSAPLPPDALRIAPIGGCDTAT